MLLAAQMVQSQEKHHVLTHTQRVEECQKCKRIKVQAELAFSATADLMDSMQQRYSRIVGRFLGLRRRIGRRFRNRRHFQSKQWTAHARGSAQQHYKQGRLYTRMLGGVRTMYSEAFPPFFHWSGAQNNNSNSSFCLLRFELKYWDTPPLTNCTNMTHFYLLYW